MTPYAIVLEKTPTNWSAWAPDLPGCVSTGETAAECEANMAQAIRFHIDGLIADGLSVPQPETKVAFVAA